MNWDQYFLKIAQDVSLKSKDINTKIGVVIVGSEKQIISTGYNSFPRGIVDIEDYRQERPEKYYWFSHAEVNAIYNAALNGVSTKDSTMYMTCGIPCCSCAQGIINAGIKTIVCNSVDDTKGDHWQEHSKRSEQMFDEAGIFVVKYT